MSDYLGISKLPVAEPFPVGYVNREFNIECKPLSNRAFAEYPPDVLVKKTPQTTLKSHLAKFFRRKHTKI